MKKRIRQTMGSLVDLEAHLKQANEWARLCPTPRTCRLSFRVVVNERISAEILPYVWRIRGNVYIEVRKLRREAQFPTTFGDILPLVRGQPTQEPEHVETIGRARMLTVRQFYYIYCFLSDIKSFAAHSIQPIEEAKSIDPDDDELECQICMDKPKEIALPCTHSFCFLCFKSWTAQSKTCPICRSKLGCSEGDDLWDLMSSEVDDIGAYSTDLVSRIYEFLEKRPFSTFSEDSCTRSAETLAAASLVKCTSISNLVTTDFLPTNFQISLPTIGFQLPGLTPEASSAELADLMLAWEIASGEDQVAALRHYEQVRRDQVLAMALAMEVDDDIDD